MPGGGVALLKAQEPCREAARRLDGDEKTGARIIHRSLEEPIRQIAHNAGVRRLHRGGQGPQRGGNFGFNALTTEYEDLVSAGVIDPTMVTRSALQNAASIGGLLVTTDVIVAEPEEDMPAMPAGGGMGGMM